MDKPNILLVILDSVRARNTSLHNYPVNTTPNIQDFARNATTYTQARAPSIHSIASHVSIFSGYHVEEHRLSEHESKLSTEASIWTELSETHGYMTGLFSPNVVLTRASNLGDHFDTVVGAKREQGLTPRDFDGNITTLDFIREALGHDQPIRSLQNGFRYKMGKRKSHDLETEKADIYLSEFFKWQEKQNQEWAACLNLMDAHYPYMAESDYHLYEDPKLRELLNYFEGPMAVELLTNGGWWVLEALEYLYDECIRQVDAAINALIEGLKTRGEFENTLVVLTSDHGEAFGEFSQVSPNVRLCDHSWGIHEVQTHVPLVVKYPNENNKKRIDRPASLTEFPQVVRETIVDKNVQSFVPKEGSVLTSTYRVPESSNILPETVSESDYVGPWRAIYESTNDGVVKYTTHGEDGGTVEILNAQESIVRSRVYPSVVDETFDALSDARVFIGNEETDEDVEDRLEALGYMR